MVMIKLKLVKGNNADEADATENRTSPSWDVNHGTKVM